LKSWGGLPARLPAEILYTTEPPTHSMIAILAGSPSAVWHVKRESMQKDQTKVKKT
jgi:hypothetical protein